MTDPISWHEQAIEDLTDHDDWRLSRGWDAMAEEIITAIQSASERDYLFPKQQCVLRGEALPVFRTYVEVRSKRFRVYYLDQNPPKIRRILHPGRDTAQVEQ